ncbi:MAG: PKD domain-containing protein [Candidatus Hydrogenedentes bacterium]|nr:PKD domain-containing protein [Candidatus Hydrogenedentota bacterium]
MPRWSFTYRSAVIVLTALVLAGCPQTTPDPEPIANFTASPRSGNTGLTASFTDLSTTVGVGSIVSWQWDFGDGSRSIEPNPTHTYLSSGEFTVSLTVSSSGGTHTRTRIGYIIIDSPSGSDQLDGDGGTVSTNGVSITVPAGALQSRVDFGVTQVTTEIPFSVFETINRVGDTFRITHDSTTSLSTSSSEAPFQPVTLSIPYAEDVVPTGSRIPAKVHIIAQLSTGDVIPILGSITSGSVEAEVGDLPADALYTVVYRPDAYLASLSIEAKEPTGGDWNQTWQAGLSPALLSQLTALRLGDVQRASSFFETEFSQEQLDDTEAALLAGLIAAQQKFEGVQSRSPRLLSMNGAYTALYYNVAQGYPATPESFDGVYYAGSPFGSIVLDPRQLLALSAWNADRLNADASNVDIAQILSADQAVAEVLTRAVVAGYDLPDVLASSLADGTDVGFAAGIEEGLALYLGQMNGGLGVNRTQLTGDKALLSTPVLAPFDLSVAGYKAASQDFYRYVANRYSPESPLAYILSGSGAVKGFVEEIREALSNLVNPTFEDAAALSPPAIDEAFLAYLNVSLGEAYFNFAVDLAFEHGADGVLRPSDEDRLPLVLDEARFGAGALLSGTLTGADAGLDFAGLGLTAITPLTSRAIIVAADPAAASLRLTFNRDDWTADDRGQSIEILVYREGLDGVALPAGESVLTFNGFEADAGETTANFYILVVNTSVTTLSSVEVTVESFATE